MPPRVLVRIPLLQKKSLVLEVQRISLVFEIPSILPFPVRWVSKIIQITYTE